MTGKKLKALACGLLSLAIMLAAAGATDAAENLRKIRIGIGTKAITPLNIDMLISERQGYCREEGLSCEAVPLGSISAIIANIAAHRLDMGVTVPTFSVAIAARGETLPIVNFFESTYPYKYRLAVKPNSSIKNFSDLKGKRIGVPTNDQMANGLSLIRAAGLDPQRDVTWITVGDGVSGGLALQRNDVDALFSYNVLFGTVEAAGIKLAYLPIPSNVPKVGGLFIAATPDFLKENRAVAVGFGRATAKTQIFIRENPEAAAYLFAEMYPEALPKGFPLRDQVRSVLLPVMKRMALYKSYDPSVTKAGYIDKREWQSEIDFAGFHDKIKDPKIFFTNDLIDEINQFDHEAVKASARDFKFSYPNN